MSFPWWVWIAIGLSLIAIELSTMTLFLIGPAVAAILTGFVALVFTGIGLPEQLLLFAGVTVVLSVAARVVYARTEVKTPDNTLNNRAARLVGRRIRTEEPFYDGKGHITLDGISWRAEAETPDDLPPGVLVEVIEADATKVFVRVAEH